MFVSRSSILVQVSKKIFGIIKKMERGVSKEALGGWKKKLKLTSWQNVYFTLKSDRGKTFILRYNMLEYFFHLRAI